MTTPTPQGAFPARIMSLLREVADREGTATSGPWEDEYGEPMQDDADAALAWIAAPAPAVKLPMSEAQKDELCAKSIDHNWTSFRLIAEVEAAHGIGSMQPADGPSPVLFGGKLFSFSTFDDWCDTAKAKFKRAKTSSGRVVCVDQRGRICAWGEHFITARDEDAFPVNVFLLRQDMADGITPEGGEK